MSVKEWNLNSPFLIKLFCLFALAPLFTCCLCSQSFPVPEEACHNTCGLRQTNNLAFGHFLDSGWVRRLLLSIRMPWHGRDATVTSYLKTLEKKGHICSFCLQSSKDKLNIWWHSEEQRPIFINPNILYFQQNQFLQVYLENFKLDRGTCITEK